MIQPAAARDMNGTTEGVWFVPFERPSFVGRKEQLARLEEHISSEGCRRLAIFGLGGCGKTALALESAYCTREQQPARAIFWVPAVSEESFEQAYREIGALLRIPRIADKNADVKRLVKEWLSDEDFGPWLMVVDNADDVSILLDPLKEGGSADRRIDFLPHSRKGSIIFTTRTRKAAVDVAARTLVDLVELAENEAEELLRTRLTLPHSQHLFENDQVVHALVDMLAFLALAIVQAAAFINKNNISLAKYISLYGESEEGMIEILSEEFEDQGRYRDTKNPVATTWYVSFSQIRENDPQAADYLSFMACTTGESIPESLLPGRSRLAATKALGTLDAYAFITEQRQQSVGMNGQQQERMFNVHRLVRLAMHNWLKKERLWNTWVNKALARLVEVVPYGDYKSQEVWAAYLHHATHVAELPEVHEAEGRVSLLDRLGYCELRLGRYNSAELTYRNLLEQKEGMQGKEDVSTIVTTYRFFLTLLKQSKLEQAAVILEEVLEKSQRILGEEHFGLIFLLNNLAALLRKQDSLEEAAVMMKKAEVMEEVLKKIKWVAGEEHPDTLMVMSILASTLEIQGKQGKAVILSEEVLKKKEKILGEEHPHTIYAMINLATMLGNQGKLEEAAVKKEEVLRMSKKIFGEKHPETIAAMGNLADTLGDQGKLDESIAMLRTAHMEMSLLLGAHHLHSQKISANLGKQSIRQFAIMFFQAPRESQKELCQQALSDFEHTFGYRDTAAVPLMRLIAKLCEYTGQLDKAEQMHHQALECFEDDLGPEKTVQSILISSLAQLYLRRGKLGEAERLFRQELQKHEAASENEGTAPMDAIRGLYGVYLHKCRNLRQEQNAQRSSRTIGLSDNVETKDIIASLAKLCEKFGTIWPFFLSLLGWMLAWTGQDVEAIIAFQCELQFAESRPEQGIDLCDGCNKQLRSDMQRFVCKTCIDIDLCSDCHADYEIGGHVSGEAANDCQAHTFLAVSGGRHATMDFLSHLI